MSGFIVEAVVCRGDRIEATHMTELKGNINGNTCCGYKYNNDGGDLSLRATDFQSLLYNRCACGYI